MSTTVLDAPAPRPAVEPAAEAPTTSAGWPNVRARWRSVLLWLVPPLVALAAVSSWFDPGSFVAAGDIGPFLREGLRAELGDLWGYGLTGAGSATGDIARLPDLVVLTSVEALGGDAATAQMVFFWLWLTAASASAVFLTRQLVASRSAAAVVGVLAVVNPLMAVNLPNPLVPAAVAVLALVGAVAVRAARGHQSVPATVVASLPVSYLVINPPTLLVVTVAGGVLAAGLATVAAPGGARRLGRHLARAGVPVVLVHLWWIVPVVYLHALGGPDAAAVTDPEAWGWTHVNNSIPAVASFTAHWGWGLREYLPFSQGLDQGPWAGLRYALPALALLAPFVAVDRRRRRLAVGALAVAVLTVLVGKGLHGPGAGFNRFLYDRVPGMWLLREPMSKVGPVLLGSYLVGVAVTVDGAVARVRSARGGPRRRRLAFGAVVAALVMAAVAFGHPVLTGGVAPTDRFPLPSSRVEVPSAWYEAAAAIDADPTEGKALVLPTLPFYQATTTWGFHGVATLPRDLLRRPVITDLPGAYYTDDPVAASLARLVEGGDAAGVDRALEALGVSHVLVRRDLADAQAALPVADGAAIADRLAGSGAFGEVTEYGDVVTVLRRSAAAPVTVSSASAQVSGSAPAGIAAAVAATPPGVTALGPDSAGGAPTTVLVSDRALGDGVLRVPVDGEHRVDVRLRGTVTARVAVDDDGLLLDPGAPVVVAGRRLAGPSPVEVPTLGRPRALAVNGDLEPVGVGGTVDVTAGDRVRAYSAAGAPVPVDGWSATTDCNRVDDRDAGIEGEDRNGVVRLRARLHAACTDAALPSGPMEVALAYRVRSGDHGRACVHVAGRGCVVDVDLPPAPGWTTRRVALAVPAGARLFLYAEAEDGPTAVSYRDVTARPLRGADPVTIEPFSATQAVELAAGDIPVRLGLPAVPSRVGPPSPVQDCDDRGDPSVLSAEVAPDGAVELRADADTACVRFPVSGLVPGHTYDLSFEHRTRAGRPARWCLWLERAGRCANRDPLLPPTTAWTEAHEQITVPEGAGPAFLYVYADGQRRPVTTVGFRGIDVRAAAQSIVVLDDGRSPGGASVEVQASSSERHEVEVHGDGQPFVLALRDSAHDGWRLEGLPDGAQAEAVTVDGFRQGWVVDGLHGDADLVVRFGPARWAHLATLVSVVTLVLVLAAWAFRSWRWRRLRRLV